uniref:DUF4005 domain-containing protein n=1 Tax=Kalanchoe fedtschenkoi TaxID=63787 RepID=A0A7N0V267_KALFE
MGKSPGKWIKAKLFGKKSTKSSISKKGEAGKEVFIVSKASSGFMVTEDSVISDPQPVAVYRNGVNLESGDQTVTKPVDESTSLLSGSQDGGVKSTELTSVDHSYTLQQQQAAAKVQAALRGFLARRAFWALKGIIRLQALIRGHLVRRQAVATLHCMQGIVRFQALVRGRKVRLSEAGMLVKDKCDLENLKLDTMGVLKSNRPVQLSRNVFAQKLLAALPNATPLSLQYDSDDANSAWIWLERWSSSHFWELVVEPKKDNRSKNSRKSSGNKGSELEYGRPKRGVRRNSSTNLDNGKPRGAVKRSISHQAEPAQENNQIELEKVKRNLRKVSLTKQETEIEKPKIKVAKMRETASPVVTEQQGLNISAEKHSDPTDSIPNEKHDALMDTILVEKGSDPCEVSPKEPGTVIPPHQVVEESPLAVAGAEEPSGEPLQQSIQKDENSSAVEELYSKGDPNCKENQRARRRRSLSTKHEYPENGSQNTPTLPSYMQATKSAKAKLRAQGSSPRLSQDTPESGAVRRHSLPSSTSGKLNTPSPRIQKLVQQGSSKGGVKSDKALSASKDYNNNSNERVAEWRR